MNEIILSIIANTVNELTKKTHKNIVQKICRKRFVDSLKHEVDNYISNNECMYFSRGAFNSFLNNYHPIERILRNSLQTTSSDSCEGLYGKLVDEAVDAAKTHDYYLSLEDKRALLGLFKMLGNRTSEFYSNNLSDEQKLIIAQNEKNNQEVIEKIENYAAGKNKDVELIRRTLDESVYLSPSVVKSFTNLIVKKIWMGEFDELSDILAAFKGKSKDIELIEMLFKGEMLKETYSAEDRVNYLSQMTDPWMRDCVIRNIIPLMNFGHESFKEIIKFTNSEYLKSIMTSLENKDYSYLFDKHIDFADGVEKHSFTLNKSLCAEEEWLVKQLFTIFIYKTMPVNAVDLMISTVDNNRSWFTNLIIYDRQVDFISCKKDIGCTKDKLVAIKEELIANEKIYSKLSVKYAAIYYALLIKIELQINYKNVGEVRRMIPQEYSNIRPVEDFLLAVRINEGRTSFDEVHDFCKKTGEFWLLSNYILSFKDKEDDLVNLVNKNKYILNEDENLFFIYVESLIHIGDKDNARKILSEYKDKYDSYYEYWNSVLLIDDSELQRNEMIALCQSDGMKCTSGYSYRLLIEKLIQLEEYKLAEKYNKILEIIQTESSISKKYKAFILNGLNRKIDSLEIFKEIFDDYSKDPAVINAVISLSLQMKRRVENRFIEAAEKSNNPKLLALASGAYSTQGNKFDARRCNMRALFLSDKIDNPAFSQYIGLSLDENDADIPIITCVEKNTATILKPTDESKPYVYCIHEDQDLPESPLKWHDDIHVYVDDAAKNSIYRKKKGDEVIYDGRKCLIEKIEPLDCYITRICFENMTKNGSGKAIMAQTVNGEFDFKFFSDQLRAILPDEKDSVNWIEQYNNHMDVGLTLFMYKRNFPVSYTQFVNSMLEDHNTCIREEIFSNPTSCDKYILSFTSLVILSKLDFPLDILNKYKVCIPESAELQICEDTRTLLSRYAQDNVSSMGLYDGKAYLIETDEATKDKWINVAGQLKDYVSRLQSVSNTHDWNIKKYEDVPILDILGTPDYDAFAIAVHDGCTLIVTESIVAGLSLDKEIGINSVCLTDFFIAMKLDCIEILNYIRELIKYGCIYSINYSLIDYIIANEDSYDDENKTILYSKWDDTLAEYDSVPDTSKPYAKKMLTELFVKKFQLNLTTNYSPIATVLLHHLIGWLNITSISE